MDVEITTNSTSPPFWYQGSIPSHEPTQLAGSTEVQSNENQVVWPLRAKETDNSRFRPLGIWPSSPHMNVSIHHLFADPKLDNENVSARSILSGYAPSLPLRPCNDANTERAEEVKKSETSAGCRLFGFDLKNNSNTVKKSTSPPAPDSDKPQNLDTKEMKQANAEVLAKEPQSKAGSAAPSSRTRTKVNYVKFLLLLCLCSNFFICIFDGKNLTFLFFNV